MPLVAKYSPGANHVIAHFRGVLKSGGPPGAGSPTCNHTSRRNRRAVVHGATWLARPEARDKSRHVGLKEEEEGCCGTERGVPVATLSPLCWERDAEVMLEALAGSGVVRPPVAELPEAFFK